MKKLETQYNSLQVLSTITKLGTKEVYSSINVLFLRMKLLHDNGRFLFCSRYLIVTQLLSYNSCKGVGVLRDKSIHVSELFAS